MSENEGYVNYIPTKIECGDRQLCDLCGADISKQECYQCLFKGDGLLTICEDCVKNKDLIIKSK